MAIPSVGTGVPVGVGVRIDAGTGSPEGLVTGSVGALWIQTNGLRGQTLWRKYSGTGNTSWSLIDDYVLNVLDFGAKCDGVTDDTTAIQAAIDAANALAYGIVYIPAKDANNGYVFTQLKYYPGTHIKGDGFGGTFGGSRGTWLYQKSGTVLEMVIPSDPAALKNRVTIEDIGFSAFNNQASNTGGIRLESSSHALLFNVGVYWTNVYGIQLKQGGTGGEMYNSFIKCTLTGMSAGASCFLITSNATQGPDATSIIDCHVSVTSATFIKVDGTLARGGGELTVIGSKFISGASVIAFDQQGTGAQFIGNRFEAIGGGSPTMTVTIAPSFGQTASSKFLGNTWTAPGGLIWNDTQAGVRRSPRIAEDATPGPVTFIPAIETSVVSLTYSASITPNSESEKNIIVATNGTAYTINAPNPRRTGRIMVFDIKNSSGGAMGVVTWNAIYKLAGAFVNPANTFRRIITFYDDGTNMIELYRSVADI